MTDVEFHTAIFRDRLEYFCAEALRQIDCKKFIEDEIGLRSQELRYADLLDQEIGL